MRVPPLPWAKPFRRRCRVHLPRPDAGGPYWGRCELSRGHADAHALERGLGIVRFWPADQYKMGMPAPAVWTEWP